MATGQEARLVDVVETHGEAAGLDQPPLIVRSGLQDALGPGALDVRRLNAGHSNATFLIEHDGRPLVLRRPPRPPYSAGAHDVLREHRLLAALDEQDVPTPRPVLACDDDRPIGAPFYVMERLDGVVVHRELPAGLAGEHDAIAGVVAETLARLHAVDHVAAGLGDLGRPDGYLERQVRRWGDQWDRNQTRAVRAIDETGRLLRAGLPSSPAPTIVHGDYKLDNLLLAAEAPVRVLGILDWEMATIGDPLADVGFMTAMWLGGTGDPDCLLGISAATAEDGFPARDALAERYAAASGRDLGDLAFYEGLALWKLAILLEDSRRRYLDGRADDPFFELLADGVPAIGERALRAVQGRL